MEEDPGKERDTDRKCGRQAEIERGRGLHTVRQRDIPRMLIQEGTHTEIEEFCTNTDRNREMVSYLSSKALHLKLKKNKLLLISY